MTEDHPTTQVCISCKQALPLTVDHWHASNDRTNGFREKCKQCRNKEKREKYHSDPNVREAYKQRSHRWYQDNKESAREYHRKYREKHADYIKERKRKWRAVNREYLLAKKRQYYRENRETLLQATRQWKEDNREYHNKLSRDYAARHRAYTRRKSREWRQNNPDKASAIDRRKRHIRRSLKARAKGDGCTKSDIRRKWQSQNGLCWHCNTALDENDYHLDHLIPLCKGGTNESRNIVLSCPYCNLSKHDKLPSEWSGRLF